MNEKQLQKLVQKVSLKEFGRPFLHQARINYRMTTTGGRYHLRDHHIEINSHFLIPQYRGALIGIIKHELCHYHLHLAGKGYRHRDQDFKLLLKKTGASRYTPDIGLARQQKKYFLYRCRRCGQEYPRVRCVNTNKFFCGRCRGQLQLIKIFA